VPESLWQAVSAAPLPADDSARELALFANRQTGQLEIANLRPPAIRHIVETCEAEMAKAVKQAK